MTALWLLTKKNLRLLIRAKSSALIVFFAPLLIILILGLSFNTTSKYGLNIGVHSTAANDDTTSFINSLKEQEFNVIKYDTLDQCTQDVKQSLIHTCIDLPPSLKVESNQPIEITFYIDQSKINIVWMVQQTIQEKFNLKEQQLTENIASDLLGKLSDTNAKIATEIPKLNTAKDKNDNAVKNTDDTKTSLASLDLNAPTTVYDLTAIDQFKTQLSAQLLATSQKIADTKIQADKMNASSTDKKKISALLLETDQTLANASALLDSEGIGSLNAVTTLVSSIQTDLDATKTKLTTASDKIKTSNTNLDSVKSSLTESISQLQSIQSTLNQINTNLQSQKITQAGVIAKPLITKIQPVSTQKTHLSYLFPILLILVIMFSSLMLGTSLVMMEKNSPAFFRNFFLPIRKITFILSIYLTNVILILIQVAIILLLSLLFIPEISPILLSLALILFLAASIFTFLGMVIGYFFTSEETSTLASISVGSLLLFISGTILPLEATSPAIRSIISFSPYVIAERAVRELVIFQAPLSSLWVDILLLLGYTIVLFLIIIVAESVLHKQILNRFLKHHHKIHRQNQKMGKN